MVIDLAAPACPRCASSDGALILEDVDSRFECHACLATTALTQDDLFWSTAPSRSPLGQDITIPGVDVDAQQCPLRVIERCWAIAFVFQHWKIDQFEALVEDGRAVADGYASFMQNFLDCRVEDTLLVRCDVEVLLCQFATQNPNESVYDCTIGGLLQRDPDSMATFITFRLRYDHSLDALIGLAFDFEFEVT